MKLVFTLALRDLLREKLHLVCNVAVLVGIIVPLLVLFGVKNGVYEALLGRLLSNPATLQVNTVGNNSFAAEDAAEIRTWAEAGFVTLKTRSLFDFVNIRPVDGRQKRDAVLIPSGAGDPTLPQGISLEERRIAISEPLATQLDLSPGDPVHLITQASERPRQMRLEATVAAVIPANRLRGRSILADIEVLDLVEAFYDEYAIPAHGITEGRPLSERIPSFEGIRAYAAELELLGPLQNRIETRFGISTEARTAEVEGTLGLGRNLNIALALTAAIAAFGLGATLIFSFWGEVARKRQMIASLSLIGIPENRLWIFPVSQAFATACLGLVASFLLFVFCATLAQNLFGSGFETKLVRLSLSNVVMVILGVLAFVTISSFFAARQITRIDPAIVLREAV
ncbi:MAG: ABC transporter permease [Pseudomonadota bacterium]